MYLVVVVIMIMKIEDVFFIIELFVMLFGLKEVEVCVCVIGIFELCNFEEG